MLQEAASYMVKVSNTAFSPFTTNRGVPHFFTTLPGNVAHLLHFIVRYWMFFQAKLFIDQVVMFTQQRRPNV